MNRVASAAGSPPSMGEHNKVPITTLPLTGRGAELSKLTAALHHAEGAQGATVLLAGESGVGKSRLASTLADHAAKRGFKVGFGRAYPVETGVPYAVFGDALLPLLRALDAATMSLLTRGGSAELVQLFPALGTGDRSGTARQVRGDPSELRARLLWNFTQFLSRLAARQPLLIVLDNLQWADSASLELLHFTARQIGSDRILILGTYNDADSAAADARSPIRSLEASLVKLGVAQSLRLST